MSDHDDLVRASFTRQVGLFSGPDSPFVRRPAGTLEQVEPLDDGMLVLDVCCGAAHAAEVIAPPVRMVVGVDLTERMLELGAARLAEAGVRNVLLQEGNAQELPFVGDCVASSTAVTSRASSRKTTTGRSRCRSGRRRRTPRCPAEGPRSVGRRRRLEV